MDNNKKRSRVRLIEHSSLLNSTEEENLCSPCESMHFNSFA